MVQELINPTDLFIHDGTVCHLGIGADMFSPLVVLCGSPGRVSDIGEELLTDTRVVVGKRGLTSVKGIFPETGAEVLVTTSGMGTGSTSIILDEIVALNEIDLRARRRKPVSECRQIRLIRVGTSGALQAHTKTGTMMIASAGLGLDNCGVYHDVPLEPRCRAMIEKVTAAINGWMPEHSYYKGKMLAYASWADRAIVEALEQSAREVGVPFETGVTVSAPGLYAQQGHNISRVPPVIPDIDFKLGDLGAVLDDYSLVNFEMEFAEIAHFIGGLGYQAGAVCLAIDNRRWDQECANVHECERNAALCALKALSIVGRN